MTAKVGVKASLRERRQEWYKKHLYEHGLYFLDDILHFSHPTDEENEEASRKHKDQFPHLQKFRCGDKNDRIRARVWLLEKNKPFVRFVIKRTPWRRIAERKDRSLEYGDILSFGELGFMRALESFDYTKSSLTTYTWWWVTSMLRRLVHNSGTIRIPVHMQEMRNRLASFEISSLQETGEVLNENKIAELLDIEEDFVEEFKTRIQSLPRHVIIHSGDEEETKERNTVDSLAATADFELFENFPIGEFSLRRLDEEIINERAKIRLVIEMLSDREVLPERDALILKRRYGLNEGMETLQEIADSMGIGKERVRQLETRALKKLRAVFKAHGFSIL